MSTGQRRRLKAHSLYNLPWRNVLFVLNWPAISLHFRRIKLNCQRNQRFLMLLMCVAAPLARCFVPGPLIVNKKELWNSSEQTQLTNWKHTEQYGRRRTARLPSLLNKSIGTQYEEFVDLLSLMSSLYI